MILAYVLSFSMLDKGRLIGENVFFLCLSCQINNFFTASLTLITVFLDNLFFHVVNFTREKRIIDLVCFIFVSLISFVFVSFD